jgi:hypothetical protein
METRFLSHVEKTDDCWLWTGCKTKMGYGLIGGQTRLAHRCAYELWVGEIPDGLVVRHKCRNKHCVNPEHLETGTQKENITDKVRDGTQQRGENVGGSKLTEDQVRDIRNRVNQTQQSLADEFGVSRRMISFIINRVNWAHIT